MNEEYAGWNTKYMSNGLGKPIKISKMTINQVNSMLRFSKQSLKVISSNMNGLYERRFILLRDEQDYTRKNHKEKIVQCLGLRKQIPDNRLKEILNLALQYIEEDKPMNLIKAILEQARDEN